MNGQQMFGIGVYQKMKDLQIQVTFVVFENSNTFKHVNTIFPILNVESQQCYLNATL